MIAARWIHSEQLPVATVALAIVLMGFSIALQFPILIYYGGLLGLQRQISLNILDVASALFRTIGAVFVLAAVSRSVTAFFVWQALVSVCQIIVARLMLWRSLPHSGASTLFNLKLIVPLWRFATGMAGIAVTGIILMNLD